MAPSRTLLGHQESQPKKRSLSGPCASGGTTSEPCSASSSQLLPGYKAPGPSRESGGYEPIATTPFPVKAFLGQEEVVWEARTTSPPVSAWTMVMVGVLWAGRGIDFRGTHLFKRRKCSPSNGEDRDQPGKALQWGQSHRSGQQLHHGDPHVAKRTGAPLWHHGLSAGGTTGRGSGEGQG